MTPTQRLPVSLTPLDVALALLLEGIRPVGPIEMPLAQALGLHCGGHAGFAGASGLR